MYACMYVCIFVCGISRKPLKVCQQKIENIIYFHFAFNFA